MGLTCQLKPSRRTRKVLTANTVNYYQARIVQATLTGSVTELTKIIVSDPDSIYWKDGEGRSILHLACTTDRVGIVEYATQKGADINGKDKHGNTAMHVAIETDALECLETLLQRDANSCLANNKKQAPIHLATQLNKQKALQILVKHMAKVDILNSGEHGRTALHIAAIFDYNESAKIILSSGLKSILRKTCDNGFTPLHEAARNSSATTLQTMIDWGSTMGLANEEMMKYSDPEGNLPIHFAVHGGDIKAVKVCLNSGALISNQQRDLSTPVHLACSLGELDIVKLMFSIQPEEMKACLEIRDAQEMAPLHYAAMFDHTQIVEYLISEGADINPVDLEKRTPILLAASRGAWNTVHFLMRNGAEMTMKDITDRNIIHYIVMNGGNLKEFTPQLPEGLQQSKDVFQGELRTMLNQKDGQGCTPLHYSSRGGQIRSTESLIQLGACVNLKDKDNKSPIHFAARFGRYNTMMELLQSDRGPCIINEADGQGLTPLHIASQNGHTRIVRLLLAKGALLQRAWCANVTAKSIQTEESPNDAKKRNHSGRTPLHLAAMNGYTQTIELLLSVHSHLLDQVDKDGNTPLHLAIQENHPSVITLLLNTNCKILTNNSKMTPMDVALLYKHSDAAMAMATHKERAYEILQMNSERSEGVIHSLIGLMPDVFSAVLDQCMETSNLKQDNKSFFVKYSFKYLQYSRDTEKEMTTQKQETKKHTPLPAMNTMIQYRRLELLTHPVCQKYIQMKWNSYGMYFHTANLFVYMVFVGFLTVFALRLMKLVDKPLEEEDPLSIRGTDYTKINMKKVTSSSWDFINAFIVMAFAIVNCIKETVQFYQQKGRYVLDIINALEWTLYVSAGLMSMPVFTEVVSDFHLTCAATAVFIAWFNLLLYLQRFDRVGIYVVMFLEILQTLLKALMIFSILVVAFGLSFYILMSRGHHLGFSNIPMSLIRVFSMMLGEFDFLGTFVYPYFNASATSTTLPYPHYSLCVLIIFMVLMPILLVNLLIGLAVGDIDSVRQNAYLKRLAMQVELHTELERKLPRVLLEKVDKEEIIEYPNTITSRHFPWFWNLIQKWFGSVYTNTTEMQDFGDTENDFLCSEMQKQQARLKTMSSTIQQLHQMVRLVVQKMEIQTEANDMDEGIVFSERKHSKWSSPSLAVKLRSVSVLMKGKRRRD